MKFARLKRRSDFISLTKRGHRQVTPAFVLQSSPNKLDETRIGFTASKKIGNAVERNRAKRRLRALVDQVMVKNEAFAGTEHNIVLVARFRLLDYTFEHLKQDLEKCLKELGFTV